MSYRQPADDPALRERARRERAELAEREDVSAERGTFTGYDAPAARALGGAGGPGGGGTPVPAAPTPDPDDPDTGPLTLMRDAEVDDALTRVTLTFSRAVDLASAQVPGRFTITERRTPTPIGVATPYTVSTSGRTLTLTFSSTLHPNTVHWITVNALTSDLHAYGDPGVFLAQGVRTAVFDTTVSPLEVISVEHGNDYTSLEVTFNRNIDTDLGTLPASLFDVPIPVPGSDPVSYTSNRPTGVAVSGATISLTGLTALSPSTDYLLRVINYASTANRNKGVRDTLSPPSFLVRAPATRYDHNFTTDPAPAFQITSARVEGVYVYITVSNPVAARPAGRGTISILNTDTNLNIAEAQVADNQLSDNDRTIRWRSRAPLPRPGRFTAHIAVTVLDIYGQRISNSGFAFTSTAPFHVVAGTVSSAMRSAPYTVSFEFNRAVNPDTLTDDGGTPVIRARQDVAQNPNSFTPESLTVSADGETVTLTFSHRLSSATGWVLDIPNTVTSSDGEAIVGVQQKFTVENAFVMIRAPHLPAVGAEGSGSSHAIVWFDLSHDDVASIQGRGTVTRLDQAQFRATVGGTDAWSGTPPAIQRSTWTGRRRATWQFAVKPEYVGSGRTLKFELPTSLMTSTGLALTGGAGGTLENGWWSWDVTLSGPPAPARLAIRDVAFTSARIIEVEFAEAPHFTEASTLSNYTLRTTSGATTSNSILAITIIGTSAHITLRTPLTAGQGVQLIIAAGIRSASTDPVRRTHEETHNITWAPRPPAPSAFTVLRSEWDGDRARAKFYFSKRVRSGNNASFFSYSRDLIGRVASATGSNTSRGFIVDIDFRTPIPAGNHAVRADASSDDGVSAAQAMRSFDNTPLTGTAASRTLRFSITGSGPGPAPGFTLPQRYPRADRFTRGISTVAIAYSPRGSLALVRSQLQNPSNWSISAADRATDTIIGPREDRFPRITRIRVTTDSPVFPLYDYIEFTLSIPPRYHAIWVFRGPSPRFGNDVSREFERVTLTT